MRRFPAALRSTAAFRSTAALRCTVTPRCTAALLFTVALLCMVIPLPAMGQYAVAQEDSTAVLQSAAPSPAAPSPPGPSSAVLAARQYTAAGIVGTAFALNVVDAYMNWWKGAAKPFSFYQDRWFNNEHLGIDKVGHFYGTYSLFKGVRTSLLYGGYQPSTALWWGIGLGLFNALEIEIGDGFSPYGFDYTDLICGVLGVGYGVLQTEVPALEHINFKVSYWSSTGFRSPANFVRDYDAMTVWLSIAPHGLLPGELGRAWPRWLAIGFGYGTGGQERWRDFLFGVDINLGGIGFGQTDVDYAATMLDLIHWPSPGVNLSPSRGPQYRLFLLR